LPSPRIRLPSEKFRLKSIGVPPPHNAATGFGTYAGTIIQKAASSVESNGIMNDPALIM